TANRWESWRVRRRRPRLKDSRYGFLPNSSLRSFIMAGPFAEKAGGLDTATENESRFFRKRIVYGEKGVRPIAVCVGTPIEPSKLFRAVKERIEVDDKERKHL